MGHNIFQEQRSVDRVDAKSQIAVRYTAKVNRSVGIDTGHAPFRAESSYSVLRLITDKEPRPIREINPDVPEWLCAIIGKLMAKQADERFGSAKEVAEVLEECLAHVQRPQAMPLPEKVISLAPKMVRRPPISKFIGAAAFAFSLIFAGVLVVLELNKGTLTIESDAEDVPIRIMQAEKVVERMTVTKAGNSVRVAAGNYLVVLDATMDDMVIENDKVVLSRGSTERIKIRYSPTKDRANSDDTAANNKLAPSNQFIRLNPTPKSYPTTLIKMSTYSKRTRLGLSASP